MQFCFNLLNRRNLKDSILLGLSLHIESVPICCLRRWLTRFWNTVLISTPPPLFPTPHAQHPFHTGRMRTPRPVEVPDGQTDRPSDRQADGIWYSVSGRVDCLILEAAWWGVFSASASQLWLQSAKLMANKIVRLRVSHVGPTYWELSLSWGS